MFVETSPWGIYFIHIQSNLQNIWAPKISTGCVTNAQRTCTKFTFKSLHKSLFFENNFFFTLWREKVKKRHTLGEQLKLYCSANICKLKKIIWVGHESKLRTCSVSICDTTSSNFWGSNVLKVTSMMYKIYSPRWCFYKHTPLWLWTDNVFHISFTEK